MFKFISACAVAILVSIACSAAPVPGNSLKGYVRDNNGKPLEGAIVELPDIKVGAATDSSGYYYIGNLPKGKFLVVASLISFSKTTISLTIAGDAVQDFTLSESAVESQEVVVTGQSKTTEIRRSPVPLQVVNNEYLRTNLSTNIIEAIAKVPGVYTITTGPNVSKPMIRGLGYNRVLTLYNGMRQEGQQWGDEHGVEVDEYAVDRIELVKGPSSLIYGSDALAGVVNLVGTPHAPDGKIAGEVVADYETNNGQIGGSGMLTGSRNGMFWQGRVSHKQAKNYQNPVDGRVYGTAYNETDASGALGISRKWGYAHLDLSMYNDVQAVPDGSRDSASRRFTKQITEADTARSIVSDDELNSYGIPTVHQHVQHYRVLSSNSFNILKGCVVVNAGFSRSIRQEFSHPEHPDVPGLYLALNTYTYDVRYHFHSIKSWDVTGGINGMYQGNDVTGGTDFVIPSYRQFDAGPFVVFEKSIGKLNIAGGVRYDSRSFHNEALAIRADSATGLERVYKGADTAGVSKPFAGYDHTFSGLAYSLGVTYVFSKQVAVKANVARGFRAPNITEISANGVHPGTNIYQQGNASFRSEYNVQEDIGLSFTSDHLSVNASVFNNNISNYIYNKKIGSGGGIDTFRFVQGDAELYGGELDIDIHPHPLDWLHFENSFSMVYARNRTTGSINDSNRYLPFIPPAHLVSELRADFKKPAKHLQNLFVKVQAAVYLAQDRVYLADNTETPTPGYTLVNAGAGSDIVGKKGKRLFNIALFANNLLDAAYQDHLSRPKYFEPYPGDPRGRSGIYNMGRNIGIKICVPFSI